MEKQYPLPMDIHAIQECIPHRYPFLLIDRVLDYRVDDFIHAIRSVSFSDPILQGHFPQSPVMPGVLIVEALAQAAAVLGRMTIPGGFKECLLAEVNETRFRRPVVPGDTVHLEAFLVRKRAPFYWFDGKAIVDGHVAATVKFCALMK